MDSRVRAYLADIGRKGGRKSRRALTPEQAQRMVRLREARRAYQKFHTSCFWSFDPGYVIQESDIPWIAQRVMEFGGRDGWERGARLCR
jgi:hypothetical protein